jgi:hypothetical protein
VLYIRPTDLFHFSPSAKAEFLACRAFPFSRMDESAWHYLRRTILSFAARAFTAWSVRFNFAAIRRIDVLANFQLSKKDPLENTPQTEFADELQ